MAVVRVLFVVGFLLAVSQVRDYGWGDPYILLLLVLASLSLLAFVMAELTCTTPLVNLKLYTNVQFTLASVVTFFSAFTNFGTNFVLSLFLQRERAGKTAGAVDSIPQDRIHRHPDRRHRP